MKLKLRKKVNDIWEVVHNDVLEEHEDLPTSAADLPLAPSQATLPCSSTYVTMNDVLRSGPSQAVFAGSLQTDDISNNSCPDKSHKSPKHNSESVLSLNATNSVSVGASKELAPMRKEILGAFARSVSFKKYLLKSHFENETLEDNESYVTFASAKNEEPNLPQPTEVTTSEESSDSCKEMADIDRHVLDSDSINNIGDNVGNSTPTPKRRKTSDDRSAPQCSSSIQQDSSEESAEWIPIDKEFEEIQLKRRSLVSSLKQLKEVSTSDEETSDCLIKKIILEKEDLLKVSATASSAPRTPGNINIGLQPNKKLDVHTYFYYRL